MNHSNNSTSYRGRIAPTPTGYLHLGHAATFKTAERRARQNNGTVIFRNEDLDSARCKKEFIEASMQDLKDIGIDWDEGPHKGGEFGPYSQSERMPVYLKYWRRLADANVLYPCTKSRKQINETAQQNCDGETIFPKLFRPLKTCNSATKPDKVNWRFKVPDGEVITFHDGRCGETSYTAGIDFGDFLVWRKDGFPSYELAVVVDDFEMKISEVVRGEDLLISTARQLLLYRALELEAPEFYHCPLLTDDQGEKLAKRHKSLSIKELLSSGKINKIKSCLNSS